MIGQIIGNRYKIMRQIGSGGMAWVYLAEDTATGSQVAVKVLFPQYAEDMAYTQRFIREAKVAMSLSEAHIVRVLDYGADRDTHYLVMEYIEGRDVKRVLQEEGTFAVERVLDVAAQVSLALQHADEHGIVHRDIKPQNLMITPAGMVKVLDLGIARAHSLPSLTQSGFVGSLYYISPEQAMGGRTDIRSDIYSLGIVMYEMLTGSPPFSADTPWMIVNMHISGQSVPLAQRRPDVPEDMEWLINKAMSKDPQDRFQTPAELGEAIAWVTQGAQTARPRGARRASLAQQPVDRLYRRAIEAADAGRWQQAIDMFGQVLTQNPNYEDVADRLAEAMQQARLDTLYTEAQRLLRGQEQKKATELLMEIAATDPEYRDVRELLAQFGAGIDDTDARRRQERAIVLYGRGLMHYGAREWEQARDLFQEVAGLVPHYRDTDTLLQVVQERLAELEAQTPSEPPTPPRRPAKEPAPVKPVRAPSSSAPSFDEPSFDEPAAPGEPRGRGPWLIIGGLALLAVIVLACLAAAFLPGLMTPAPAPTPTFTVAAATATPRPSTTHTATSTVTATPRPSATRTTTPTVTPTATPVRPTRTPGPKYPAPKLLNPSNGNGYAGGPLRWEDLKLDNAQSEYYNVTFYFVHNGVGEFRGANALESQLYLVLENLPSADNDRYEWSVQVMKRTSGTAADAKDWEGIPISPRSETWVFVLAR
ncbi:MAG: protein kinase [Chloroflexi bacterium]|nr:protein kinase [Chloroflexota bacterium]